MSDEVSPSDACGWPDRVAECRLERADGTEWIVEDLELAGLEIRVDARPVSGPGKRRLEDATLRRGDLIRWLDRDETELREMRVVVPVAEASDPGAGSQWIGGGRGPSGSPTPGPRGS